MHHYKNVSILSSAHLLNMLICLFIFICIKSIRFLDSLAKRTLTRMETKLVCSNKPQWLGKLNELFQNKGRNLFFYISKAIFIALVGFFLLFTSGVSLAVLSRTGT